MKLSDKQAQLLLTVLYDSVKKNVVCLFSVNFEDRVDLYNEIVQQQSDELKKLD